ncbi:50S ribosomal protein L6 [Candidatus Saccharibacteria bacterium]|nr:50S ribosomal protein L6 [Candidatus Saccharibacteria bacterium]
MSRIGKLPITLPASVEVNVDNAGVEIKGPKGTLKQFKMPGLKVVLEDSKLLVAKENDEAGTRAKHGLMRTLLSNMVEGVSNGFEKKLEIQGVGYRVQLADETLKFNLGFSHDVLYKLPTGIQVSIEQNILTVRGISKQQVGQVAAEIRALKKPEPYKGKGIRYSDERVLRKSGKSGKE